MNNRMGVLAFWYYTEKINEMEQKEEKLKGLEVQVKVLQEENKRNEDTIQELEKKLRDKDKDEVSVCMMCDVFFFA